jgi:competence protein ComEC
MNWRQMAIFLGLNVVVSVAATLIVLTLWDSGRAASRAVPTAVPTSSAAALVPANNTPNTQPLAVTSVPAVLTATPRPTSYTVKPGDTLSSISRDFDVPLADLLAANNLGDGDLLTIGQKIVIPVDGAAPVPSPTPIRPRPVVTASVTTAGVTATQSIALGDAFVTIREITDGGALAQEAVILTNIGAKVNLIGWTLVDSEGRKFTFPDLTLLTEAEVKVHTTSGTNTATDLYWGQTAPRWSASGTIAYLRDPAGKLIATYRVP